MAGPVHISLEAVKSLRSVTSIELDPGRVESILEIALSNAVNVSAGSCPPFVQFLNVILECHPCRARACCATTQASLDGRIILRVSLATADGNPMRARAGANSDANLNAILCFEVCGGSGPHTPPTDHRLTLRLRAPGSCKALLSRVSCPRGR